MRVVGVVPAAGLARRLQPLAGSKELLLVGGTPVIERLLARLRPSCDEIRVVTRPDKHDLREYLECRDVSVVLREPDSTADSIRAGAVGLADTDTVLFGFPDTLWDPEEGFVRVLEGLRPPSTVSLGIFRGDDPARSDVVELDGDRVVRVHVKPSLPPSDLVWGCAALSAATLRSTEGTDELGVAFDALAQQSLVTGVMLGSFLDIGTPEAMQRAGVHAA